METFYQRLRRLRLEKNKTVKYMAVQIGVSLSTYRDWEYGRSIQGEPYAKIANLLGVSVENLLTGAASTPKEIKEAFLKTESALFDLRRELESFF